MKLLVKKGTTSKRVIIFIQDSTSTTGAGLAGLTSGSGGLVCYRAREDDGNAAATQLALSGGTRGTWSSGGFVEKDATNMPGVYELGLDNNGLATGSNTVVYMLKGATNMAPLLLEVQLVDFDPQDSARLGLTSLPAAAAAANGGLPTVDANNAVKVQSGTAANQINLSGGNVVLQATGLDNISVSDPGNVAGMNTLPKMLVAVWRYVFKKKTLTSTQGKFYADDGSTVNTINTVSDDGITQTWGAMS